MYSLENACMACPLCFLTLCPVFLKSLNNRIYSLYWRCKVTEVPADAAGKKKNTKTVDLTNKLFDEIAPKYADRKGGYTRIVKIGLRKGDAAMEVLLELV